MPKYSAWNKSRFGFARKEAPAFQREYASFAPSAVPIADQAFQTLVESPSATPGNGGFGASGSIFLWGVTFSTAQTAATGGKLIDDDGNPVGAVVGTCNGPFFLNLSTPIRLPQNSSLRYERVVHGANTYVTPHYVVEYLENDVEV